MTGIEQLRKLGADAVRGGDIGRAICDIADQIEREQNEMVADSPYDALPPEDRDAIAWVREHGGLEPVERRWECLSHCTDPVPRSCMEKRLARLQRQIDESHAALRRRNERIALLAKEINREHNENRMEFLRRAGNYTAFADEVCDRLAPQLRYLEGCTKDVMDTALEALDRRLMPDGMEWPRFEDGEPVRFLDDFERYGDESVVSTATMYSDGSFALNWRAYSNGERVRRHAPKVLDADGAEIRVGDTVWHVETGEQCKVVEVDSRSASVDFRVDGDGTKHTGSVLPANLTHRAPVIAADGSPLREGDTVYHVNTGIEYSVRSVTNGGAHLSKGDKPGGYCRADYLTHERPIVDTWERLEEDAEKDYVNYWGCERIPCYDCPAIVDGKKPDERYIVANCSEAVKCDLVRRARALAGDA